MSPEDIEEVKKIIDDKLTEQVISPLFTVLWIYKDVDIPEGQDEVIADSRISEAETVRVSRTFKWSQLDNISETVKRDRDLFEARNLYKLRFNTGETIYCVIKDIEAFKKDWESFVLSYGAI